MKFTYILKSLLPGISIVGLLTTACAQMTFDEKVNSLYSYTVPLVKSEEVKELLDKDNVYILDIRSQKEFDVSHIQGAKMIDYDNFDKKDVINIPKDAEVIVYCSVGYRSEKVGEKLMKNGFSNVKNLYGGIFDWKNQDNPVINPHNEVTDSVHTYNKNWSQWLYKGVKVYE
jgi:rhodanese-related sulfurtransferase